MTFAIASETSPEARAEAARFFAQVISADPAYISHGEIQTGLSPDGRTWAGDLAARFAEDLADLGDDRVLVCARDAAGALCAAAILLLVETPRVSFAVIEDLAVDPTLRSHGLGREIVEHLIALGRAKGCAWVFLESGKRNLRAHAFFERVGFQEVSHVFARRLEGPASQP